MTLSVGEFHGGVDGLLHPVLDDEIYSIRENLPCEEKESIHQGYFGYVLENTELHLPHSIEEVLSMYKELLEIANIDDV